MNKIAQVDISNTFGSPIGTSVGLTDLVSIILSNAVAISGVILLIFIVVGGLFMVIGAGQNDPQKTAQGRKVAMSAVIGFIIVFTTYWIIQLVEIVFGFEILGV